MIQVNPHLSIPAPTPTPTEPEPTSSATPTFTETATPTETASPVPVDMATTEALLQQQLDWMPFAVIAVCIVVLLLAINTVMAVRR